MQRIQLGQAAPGMVLAKKVENDKGLTICKEGTELTDQILYRLENAKVTHVSVEGHPVQVKGEKSIVEMIQDLEQRFKKVTSDPVMQELRGIVERQYKNRYGDPDQVPQDGEASDD